MAPGRWSLDLGKPGENPEELWRFCGAGSIDEQDPELV